MAASPQQHDLARVGKDVGAAAVLIAAASAASKAARYSGDMSVDRCSLWLRPTLCPARVRGKLAAWMGVMPV